MKALILAAGKGTRLRDLTRDRPKPMIEIGSGPLLAYLVTWLRSHGIREIAINLHHCPEAITSYFGDGARFGVEIVYSYESQLLGTAGAAKRLQDFLNDQFVVAYGDVYTNLDVGRLMACHADRHRALLPDRSAVTLSLYHVANPSECGIVALNDRGEITRFVEKPPREAVFTDLANAGICVVDPAVLDYVPSETPYDFGRHLLPKLLQIGVPVFGHEILENEFLIDIGTPSGLQRAQVTAASTRRAAATIAECAATETRSQFAGEVAERTG